MQTPAAILSARTLDHIPASVTTRLKMLYQYCAAAGVMMLYVLVYWYSSNIH